MLEVEHRHTLLLRHLRRLARRLHQQQGGTGVSQDMRYAAGGEGDIQGQVSAASLCMYMSVCVCVCYSPRSSAGHPASQCVFVCVCVAKSIDKNYVRISLFLSCDCTHSTTNTTITTQAPPDTPHPSSNIPFLPTTQAAHTTRSTWPHYTNRLAASLRPTRDS